MLRNNKINMVLSLIIAIALWCYAVYAVNPSQNETVKGVTVSFENETELNERGYAVANSSDITFDLPVEGSRQAIAEIGPDDITATADVSQCVEGSNMVDVDIEINGDVTRRSSSNISVKVEIEKLAKSEKTIKAEYDGSLGSDIMLHLTSDDRVSVSGAESLVESVSYVRAMVDSSKTPAAGEVYNVKLVAVNENGAPVKHIRLAFDEAVVEVVNQSMKRVPLRAETKGTPKEGFVLEKFDAPDMVTICGAESDISTITYLEASKIDISGFEESKEVELKVMLPEGVTIAQESLPLTAKITISSDGDDTVSFRGSDVKIKGLEDDMTASITTGKIKITVAGSENVKLSDFTLSIDVAGLDEGEHEVPLKIKYEGKGTVTKSTEKVTCVISGR